MKAYVTPVLMPDVRIPVEIELEDSPYRIVDRAYESDPSQATCLFGDTSTISSFKEGIIAPDACFYLANDGNEGDLMLDWKVPLSESSAAPILKRMQFESETPLFLTSLPGIVG